MERIITHSLWVDGQSFLVVADTGDAVSKECYINIPNLTDLIGLLHVSYISIDLFHRIDLSHLSYIVYKIISN